MKRVLSLVLAMLILTGCTGPAAPHTSGGYTFTDDLGRSVTVNSPKRVAALLGSFAQIWQLAGGQVCATADDAWEDLGLELPEDTVNLGNTKELSLELLLSSQPDLIIASANTRQQLEWKDTLEATGIPVAYFNVSDFDSYLHMLDICTDITGRRDLYAQHGLEVQTQIDAVLARSRERGTAPTVLCMRASGSLISVKNSRDNVLGEMLASLGCVNIADSDTSLLENISIERILELDPDFIFIAQRGDDKEGMIANVEAMMQE
ncbi:MAG: ABC transporter substrate-binding protein, partial [Oscillospiraceae bacterium]|nr:ABC transporter substrate-binding protein [Oscillospiraceae bacterium]